MSGWKFHIITFGCKVNQHESQLIREAWQGLGGLETDRVEEADYVCVNSCAITARAERDARNALNRLRRQAPHACITMTGCAAQLLENFRPHGGGVQASPDFWVPQKEKGILLKGPMEPGKSRAGTKPLADPARNYNRARAIVKVQDGCRQNCAYCIVPRTRSVLFSAEPKAVLAECRGLAENGHAEIMISGINLRHYGRDKAEYGDFWDMLAWLDRELAKDYEGKLRLRTSSLEPALLGGKALRTLAEARLVCPHLHLSLQHASPEILRRMGRGHYTPGKILEFLRKLSQKWDIFAVGADLLLGFPGESTEDLRMLLDFVEEAPLTYAHVFPFSPRPGTVAAAMDDQIGGRLARDRAAQVRAAVMRKKNVFLQKLCQLPEMTVAPEVAREDGSVFVRGVNEYYVSCMLDKKPASSALIRVRPLRIQGDCLLAATPNFSPRQNMG